MVQNLISLPELKHERLETQCKVVDRRLKKFLPIFTWREVDIKSIHDLARDRSYFLDEVSFCKTNLSHKCVPYMPGFYQCIQTAQSRTGKRHLFL